MRINLEWESWQKCLPESKGLLGSFHVSMCLQCHKMPSEPRNSLFPVPWLHTLIRILENSSGDPWLQPFSWKHTCGLPELVTISPVPLGNGKEPQASCNWKEFPKFLVQNSHYDEEIAVPSHSFIHMALNNVTMNRPVYNKGGWKSSWFFSLTESHSFDFDRTPT